MSKLVPVSEARARLSELVRDSEVEDVILTNHGRPASVMIAAERYESLLEEIEELKDRLSIHEHDGVTVSLDKMAAEFGIQL